MRTKSLIILLTCIVLWSHATTERTCHIWLNEVPLVADTLDSKLYITLEPQANTSLTGTLRWDTSIYNKVELNGHELQETQNNFMVEGWEESNCHKLTITKGEEVKEWTLAFTTLPIILLEANQAELYDVWKQNDELKSPATMSVIDARARTLDGKQRHIDFFSNIGIRVRGATSAGKEKKSFAVELLGEEGNSKNAHLLGYRDDNNWILDAMFNDFSKMRNRLMTDLWNSINDLPYSKDNSYQGNGTQGEFVEVFMQGHYWGLYCFTDKIDRKKLNLKKTQNEGTASETLRGLLWKSTFRSSATTFAGYSEYPTNDTLVWEKYWEQKYPDTRQDQAYFNPIADMIDKIMVHNKNKMIVDDVDEAFYMDNVIDYIICTQAFQWMDNLQKNMYLSVRNVAKDQPVKLLITPWDLDATLGRDAGGDPLTDDVKWQAFGEQLGGINMLIWNLTHYYTHDFANRLCHRWQYLKTHQFSLENIRSRMETYASLLEHSGAWNREYAFASKLRSAAGKKPKQADTPQEEVEFMMNFLEKNYAQFDEKISQWGADEYTEPEVAEANIDQNIYIVSPDTQSKHEDCVTTLPGDVVRETMTEDDFITYSGSEMKVVRNDVETVYPINQIKEVTTKAEGFYHTSAFLPSEYRGKMDFDTHYSAPEGNYGLAYNSNDNFAVQRTLCIEYNDTTANIVGNTFGFEVSIEGAQVNITTDLQGVQLHMSGTAKNGTLYINNTHAIKVTAEPGKKAELAQIQSSGDIILGEGGTVNLVLDDPCDEEKNGNFTSIASTQGNVTIQNGTWNIFNSAYNGKGIAAKENVVINGGQIHVITTGSGTLTDATFPADGGLGTRGIYAEDIIINNGCTLIKTLGHDGGAGLAGTHAVSINGGETFLACYDDPVKAGDNINVSGGLILCSSLTNDGMDSKGSINVSGGTIYSYGPSGAEGCFDNNGKTFAVSGGTIIGVAYKGDYPQASKSTQAVFRYYKKPGIQRYVRIVDEDNNIITEFETPAYDTTTLVISTPVMEKGKTYTITTCNEKEGEYTKVENVTAE